MTPHLLKKLLSPSYKSIDKKTKIPISKPNLFHLPFKH